MGGLCFKASSEAKEEQDKPKPKETRRVTVREEELVIAKLKVQSDRLETRLKKLEGEEAKIQGTIKSLVQQQKKEEAYFWLKKLKTTKQFAKDARTKINFVENQIANIENTLDEVQFTQTIKESNRAIENLSKQIDMDELRLAKELQEEGKMRRQELEELLEDETDDSQDLKRELDLIEKGMLEEAFEKVDVKTQPATSKKANAQTASEDDKRQALLA